MKMKIDEGEFSILLNEYLKPVYGFIYRYVGSTEDAEDITQETFVKIWRNFHKFNSQKGNLKTWIFSIAKNTAIDFLKKKKAIPFSKFTDEEGDNPILDSLSDTEPLPEELFQRKELGEILAATMERIPPNYRAVIFLHYNDHFTFQEIAEILNEPLNTVKSRHFRGILMLRKLLAPKSHPDSY